METLKSFMLEYEFLIGIAMIVVIFAVLLFLYIGVPTYLRNKVKKEKYPQELFGAEFESRFEKIAGKEIGKISRIRILYILSMIMMCIIGVVAYVKVENKTELVECLLFLYPVLIIFIFAKMYDDQQYKLINFEGKIIEQLFEDVKMIDMFNFGEHYKEANFDKERRGYKITAYNGLIAFRGKIENKYNYLYTNILVRNEYTLLRNLTKRRRTYDSNLFEFYGGFMKIACDRYVDLEKVNLPDLISKYSKFCNMDVSADREYIYIRISGLNQHKFKNKLKNEIYREYLQLKMLTLIAEDIIKFL